MKEAKGATSVIVDLMNTLGYTPSSLGNRIGVSQDAIWDRLHNSRKKERNSTDLKVSTMATMLQGMGYKLVAVPDDVDIDGYEVC